MNSKILCGITTELVARVHADLMESQITCTSFLRNMALKIVVRDYFSIYQRMRLVFSHYYNYEIYFRS